MKIQAVLFALLQAHAAVADGSGEDAPMKHAQAELPACALPCKTKLRLSPSKMKKCVNANCGFAIVENEANNHDLEYEEENSHVGEPPISDERSTNYETEEEGDDAADDTEPIWKNRGECISHCRKLRVRQDRCIAGCPEDESHDSSETKSNFDADVNQESDQADADAAGTESDERSTNYEIEEEGDDAADDTEPDTEPIWKNRGECISHCRKLRVRQDRCIAGCPEDESHDSSETKSNFDADGNQESDQADADAAGTESDERSTNYETEEEGDDAADDTEPIWKNRGECISHCRKLRVRQDRCIAGCPEDESHDSSETKSNFDADVNQESDQADADAAGTESDERSTNYEIEEEGDDAADDTEPDTEPIWKNRGECISHCRKLRVRQDRCIAGCPEDESHDSSETKSNFDADGNQESDQADADAAGTESDERSTNYETEEEGDDAADDTEPIWKNRGECISHCRKLRVRQDRCIAGCPEDESHDSSETKSNFDADEEQEPDPDDIPTHSACVRHCHSLHLSITKQKKCIHMCPDEEPPMKIELNEEDDAANTDQGYTATS